MWSPDTAWPDSWVLIGAMAGVTRRVRFSNAVYVAPARPLLEVVKQVATASVVSQGRVSLAVGVGWMREEFELMGQDFDTRGKRLNELIPALRALWRGGWVSWSGRYYQVPELMIEPIPRRRCRSCAAANPMPRFAVRRGCVTAGSATHTRGTTRSVMWTG
jgi:alkanesulfonate monooxygenase SsuD/methylene tetrahydromethanopterin reductase-like flavin-dependent oxidoreductase (luciferase family)